MARRHSIAEARRSLPTLVREAESGKTVELTRRGEPVAVLVGRRDYERLMSKNRGFTEAYREFERQVDLAALGIDPDELFEGTREDIRGREVRL